MKTKTFSFVRSRLGYFSKFDCYTSAITPKDWDRIEAYVAEHPTEDVRVTWNIKHTANSFTLTYAHMKRAMETGEGYWLAQLTHEKAHTFKVKPGSPVKPAGAKKKPALKQREDQNYLKF